MLLPINLIAVKHILTKLFDHEVLSQQEAYDTLLRISAGEYNPIQVASFTTVYNMRAVSVEELRGFRAALLELAVPLKIADRPSIDIVGTGGDGKNTFNISTLSSFVVAGAGYTVTKHGSYGVSSSVGSSDVLLALGYEFTNDSDTLNRQLDEVGLCFLHAPLFHPALKEVVPVRKQLGMKTFFNMLGPLVNPVQPSHQLYGTFSLELSRVYQYLMQQSGKRYTIVYALDGYDEISLTGPAKVRSNEAERLIHPADFGMPATTQEALFGGNTAEEAKTIFLNVLNNKGTEAQTNVVSANAGLAIQTIEPARPLEECVALARESITSGKAKQKLELLTNK